MINYYRLFIFWGVNTTKIKVSKKLSNKDDFISVDHKAFKTAMWEYIGWQKKAIGSSWVVCSMCCVWVFKFNFQDTGIS